jgi:hypothetical protein
VKHYVDDDKLVRAALDAPVPELGKKLRRFLEKQPTFPSLVSRKKAAEICDVHSPYVSRLEAQGRWPEPVPIEGSAPAYVLEEVQELADELRKERADREAKRREREEVAG